MHAMNWHMGMALAAFACRCPTARWCARWRFWTAFEPEDTADEDDEEMEEVACCPECESLEIREVAGRIRARSRFGRRPFRFPSLRCRATHRWKCLVCGYQWQEEDE